MNAPWRRAPAPAPETPPPVTDEEKAEERKRKAKERDQRYRAKNPDKVREWQRKQYLKNREKRLAAAKVNGRARAARDPGAAIARRVLSREKDILAARQREKEYRQQNADRVRELARARMRRYREVHREEERARQRVAKRAKYETHRDEFNAKRRAAYAARRKQMKAAGEDARRSDEMPDLRSPCPPLGLVPPGAGASHALDRSNLFAGLPRDLEGAADD